MLGVGGCGKARSADEVAYTYFIKLSIKEDLIFARLSFPLASIPSPRLSFPLLDCLLFMSFSSFLSSSLLLSAKEPKVNKN